MPEQEKPVSGDEQRPEQKQNIEELVERNRREILNSSTNLLRLLPELMLAFSAAIPPEVSEQAKLNEAVDVLDNFVANRIVHIIAKPRIPRPDTDKVFVPGEHQGVTIQFVTETGEIGLLNFYGGMREIDIYREIRRTGTKFRETHADVTNRVVSRPTHINFHIRDVNNQVIFDTWVLYEMNKRFQLSTLILGNQRVEAHPSINNQAYGFSEYAQTLNKNIQTLKSLISSV